MNMWHILVALIAAVIAGAVNSVAGGGTLITFPTLVWAGLNPIVANATSSLALWPGYVSATIGFRRELRQARRVFLILALPSLLGGLGGGILLLHTPRRTFDVLVPFLVLGATLLFALQSRHPVRSMSPPRKGSGTLRALALQFAAALYGGYFGAGLGFVLLVGFGLMGMQDILQMNGLKNALTVLIVATALGYFVTSGAVDWGEGLVMALGAIVGGFWGAALSRRLGPQLVRNLVLALGISVSVILLLRAFA